METYTITNEQLHKIHQATKRMLNLLPDAPLGFIELSLDIETTMIFCPLDLDKLLAFDDFNFVHDVAGIHKHLNRRTFKLQDCFVPRCAL